MRHFKFDPFRYLSKDKATVGALRSNRPDHDVSYVPGKQYDLGRTKHGELIERLKPAASHT